MEAQYGAGMPPDQFHMAEWPGFEPGVTVKLHSLSKTAP